MTVVRIQKIIWNKYNAEHIKKHNVSVEEVEKLINEDVLIKEGHSGKKIYIGKVGTRLLSVIGNIDVNKLYIVTARDASGKERQDFYEYEKSKS